MISTNLGHGLRTAPELMKMKNLKREKDMRTIKQKQNEFTMSVFGLDKMLQDDVCTDDCMQSISTHIDGNVDDLVEALDSVDCDNSEECAYRIAGAVLACDGDDDTKYVNINI